jgi:hypothetical protein
MAYYHKPWFKLNWKRQPNEILPEGWKQLWRASYRGSEVAEVWLHESGWWFARVGDKEKLWERDCDTLLLLITGIVLGGNN